MDFVSDALFDGRRLRALTVVDHFTRECLALEVGQNLKGDNVASVMNRLVTLRGTPGSIKVDNGSGFAGRVMDRWACDHGVELDFSRPGTPTDNASAESFNGCFRQECLYERWFLSLADAQRRIEAWRCFYNEARPHSGIGWATPAEFARSYWLKSESEVLTDRRIFYSHPVLIWGQGQACNALTFNLDQPLGAGHSDQKR